MDTHVLHNLSYGMYIVSSVRGNAINAQIANSVMQITSEPATVAVSINKENYTHGFIRQSKHFSISILAEDTPLGFIGQFGFKSGRTGDKFQGVKFKISDAGVPVVLEHSLGYIEAEVIGEMDAPTHTVFLGQVNAMEMLSSGKPMTYDYYHQIKRGTTPRTAPTYIKEEQEKPLPPIQKYRCLVCAYVYDPQLGDPDGGIAPGTAFEKIPDSWVCPVCGATKDQFEPV